MSRWMIAAAAVGAVLQVGLLWGSALPLGVPGEWTWDRIPFTAQHVYGWVLCGIAGVVYLLVAAGGIRRIVGARVPERVAWLVALAGCCIAWVLTVAGAVPEPAGLGRVPFVLYYPGSSGYFWQARYEIDSLPEFLRTYEATIADSTRPENYLHLGTHPPGLTAGYRLLWRACSNSPWLRQLVLASEPTSVHEAFLEVASNAQRSGMSAGPVEEACLWLAALITIGAIALTVFPLYWLVSRTCGEPALAWTVTALWPLLPSVAIFFPKSDLHYPLFAVTAQWLWIVALDRRSAIAGWGSACVLTAGMLFSLALMPVAAILALQTFVPFWNRDGGVFKPILGAIAGVALVTAAVSLAGDMNLLAIWLQNVRNHAAFYDHNPRTYSAWLVANPLELAMALGAPAAIFIAVGAVRQLRPGVSRLWWPLAVLVVWGVLWLSGKNMGEAARLWCFLMPQLLWLGGSPAGIRLGGQADGVREARVSRERTTWLALALLLLQMITCVATVTHVDGFHLSPAV